MGCTSRLGPLSFFRITLLADSFASAGSNDYAVSVTFSDSDAKELGDMKAVKEGFSKAPADLRFLRRGGLRIRERTTQVLSFLENVYSSIAETLPDVRDSVREDSAEATDPYCLALSADIGDNTETAKRNRKYVSVTSSAESSQREVRYLPPGTMREYYEQYLRQGNLAVSFKTFWLAS